MILAVFPCHKSAGLALDGTMEMKYLEIQCPLPE